MVGSLVGLYLGHRLPLTIQLHEYVLPWTSQWRGRQEDWTKSQGHLALQMDLSTPFAVDE